MVSQIGFEMSFIDVEAMRGRCASLMVLTATVSVIFGGQTTSSILVVGPIDVYADIHVRLRLKNIYFTFESHSTATVIIVNK